jgi:hypothetical protein
MIGLNLWDAGSVALGESAARQLGSRAVSVSVSSVWDACCCLELVLRVGLLLMNFD